MAEEDEVRLDADDAFERDGPAWVLQARSPGDDVSGSDRSRAVARAERRRLVTHLRSFASGPVSLVRSPARHSHRGLRTGGSDGDSTSCLPIHKLPGIGASRSALVGRSGADYACPHMVHAVKLPVLVVLLAGLLAACQGADRLTLPEYVAAYCEVAGQPAAYDPERDWGTVGENRLGFERAAEHLDQLAPPRKLESFNDALVDFFRAYAIWVSEAGEDDEPFSDDHRASERTERRLLAADTRWYEARARLPQTLADQLRCSARDS